jgi:hypothetical protein
MSGSNTLRASSPGAVCATEDRGDRVRGSLGRSITGRQFSQDNKFYDEILATNDRVKCDRAVSDLLNSARIPVVRVVGGLDGAQTASRCMFPPLQAYDGAATIARRQEAEFDSNSAANTAYSSKNGKTTTNNNNNNNNLTGGNGSVHSVSSRTKASKASKTSKGSSTLFAEKIAQAEKQRQSITEAFNWLERARNRVDPAACYYEAAKLFNVQHM